MSHVYYVAILTIIIQNIKYNKLLEQLVTSQSVELNNLVASCEQAVDNMLVNKLGTSSPNTSC
jgi:hypothetical protein